MSCNCCDDDDNPSIPLTVTNPPQVLNMSFIVGGVPFSDSSNAWVEAGRFVFSNAVNVIFTSFRLNAWRVGGATFNYRIVDLVTSNVIYTKTGATSTSVVNVELVKAQQIYNSASAIIAVQIQSVSGNTVYAGAATFGYE